MDPLSSPGIVMGTSPSPLNQLAMVLAQPETGAPGPSMMAGAVLDEELQRLLAPLYQGVGEADGPAVVALDLSFL